jgi:hypothetical protein
MGCLGVHFAIEPLMMRQLIDAPDDEAVAALVEQIEEGGDYEEWSCDTDKAWDGIHRCLTDGKLQWENGSYPLKLVILGGRRLYEGDDYIVCLVEPKEVQDVAAALENVTESEFRSGYSRIPQDEYDAIVGAEDFEYLFVNFQELVPFFRKSSDAGRAVIFTTDQ